MKNRSNFSREEREWLLRQKAKPESDWLGKLVQIILKNDLQRRSFVAWLRAQGTGTPHVQQIAFFLDAPDPAVPRVTIFEQTEREYMFLRALLDLIAEGHDVREMLDIKPYTVGHRRRDPLAASIAEEIEIRVAEGDRVGVAIRDVAKLTGRTPFTVRGIRQRDLSVNKR